MLFYFCFFMMATSDCLNNSICYSIAKADIASFIFTIFIGIAYNKHFIHSSSSLGLGLIGMCLFISILLDIPIYKIIILIFSALLILFWSSYLFYHYEVTLRRDFFYLNDSKEREKITNKILEIVPTPIIIRKNKNISLINDSLKHLIRISKNEDKELKEMDEE